MKSYLLLANTFKQWENIQGCSCYSSLQSGRCGEVKTNSINFLDASEFNLHPKKSMLHMTLHLIREEIKV